MPLRRTRFYQSIRTAWWRLVHLWRPMAGWTLLVWAVVIVLLGPLSSALLGWQLFRGDQAVIANEDLLFWLLTPAGLIYVVLAGGLALTGGVVRYSGLFYIVTDDLEGHRATVARTALRLAPQLPALFRLCVAAVVAGAVLALPLAAGLGVVYLVFLGAHDINYYLSVQPQEWTHALWAAGTWSFLWVCGAAYVVGRSALALPAFLDGHRGVRVALRKAWRLAAGRTARLLKLLAFSALAWLAVRLAANATYLAVASAAVEWIAGMSDSLQPIVIATALYLAGSFALDATVGFLGFSYLATVLTKFYHEDTELHAEAAPVRRLHRLPFKVARGIRRRLRPIPVLLAVIVLVGGSLIGSRLLLERMPETRPVMVHAHRAGPPPAPENTLAALERAIAEGAEYSEIDVQRTRDGVLIVAHDADLMRVAGDPRRIATTDFADMAGLVQRPDDGTPPSERRIATLDDFMERARGRIRLNIELKYYGWDPELGSEVVRRIREMGMEDEVVLMSLSLDAVHQLRRLAPDIPLGYLSSVAVGDLVLLPVDFLAVAGPAASPRLIREARAREMEVLVWTINRADVMADMIERGAEGIITDDPALAVRVRDELAGMSPPARLLLRFRSLLLDEEADPERTVLVPPPSER